MCIVTVKRVISVFAMLDREICTLLSNSNVPYSSIKRLDQKIRISYATDGLTGDEFATLIRKLWNTWFQSKTLDRK